MNPARKIEIIPEQDSFAQKFTEVVARTPGNDVPFLGLGLKDDPSFSRLDLVAEVANGTPVGRHVREAITETAQRRGKEIDKMIEIFAHSKSFRLLSVAEEKKGPGVRKVRDIAGGVVIALRKAVVKAAEIGRMRDQTVCYGYLNGTPRFAATVIPEAKYAFNDQWRAWKTMNTVGAYGRHDWDSPTAEEMQLMCQNWHKLGITFNGKAVKILDPSAPPLWTSTASSYLSGIYHKAGEIAPRIESKEKEMYVLCVRRGL